MRFVDKDDRRLTGLPDLKDDPLSEYFKIPLDQLDVGGKDPFPICVRIDDLGSHRESTDSIGKIGMITIDHPGDLLGINDLIAECRGRADDQGYRRETATDQIACRHPDDIGLAVSGRQDDRNVFLTGHKPRKDRYDGPLLANTELIETTRSPKSTE